jgi:pyruvate/2-oxoglutarate dehydrogenase complex dihydrolipoamide acyltransferase (E2) component
MKQNNADYQVVPYPKMRRLEAATLRSAQRTPMMHGLIEVDVTRARAFLREYQAKTGERLSFTAFLATCLAKAVEEHKAVQASRKGSKHLILFEEVDVYTPIERNVAGLKQITGYTIRAANRKTFREIHHEIRAAQMQDVAQALQRYQVFQFLPTVLLRFLLWVSRRYPQLLKKYAGTVGLTAVACLGRVPDGGSLSPGPS